APRRSWRAAAESSPTPPLPAQPRQARCTKYRCADSRGVMTPSIEREGRRPARRGLSVATARSARLRLGPPDRRASYQVPPRRAIVAGSCATGRVARGATGGYPSATKRGSPDGRFRQNKEIRPAKEKSDLAQGL